MDKKLRRPGEGGARITGLRVAVDNQNYSNNQSTISNFNRIQVSEELRRSIRRFSQEKVCSQCDLGFFVDERGSLLVRSRRCL